MRFDLGTLDSGERSLPFGLLVLYPRGQIRVCKIRFVSTGQNRGKPCLVCKTIRNFNGCEMQIENSVTRIIVWHHEACQVMPNSYPE